MRPIKKVRHLFTMRCHSIHTRMALLNKQIENNNCWQGVENLENLYIGSRNINWHSHSEIIGTSSKYLK